MGNYWESTEEYMGTCRHAWLLVTWLPSCRWDNRYIRMIDHRKTKKTEQTTPQKPKDNRVKHHKPLYTVDSSSYYIHCALPLFINDKKYIFMRCNIFSLSQWSRGFNMLTRPSGITGKVPRNIQGLFIKAQRNILERKKSSI